ncbi:hypothetical protein P8452_21806 [Trifolium repens]|nr:hypothetical protein P8452_21806 [Trifolium repens]
MRFTDHSHQKNDPPLFTLGLLGQADQCSHKNGSFLVDPGLDSSSLPKHVNECYNKDGLSFVCPDPPSKHVDQCSQENISVLHGPCLVGSSLSKHPGECNQKNGSALHDPCLVDSSVFKHPGECNQKNGSSLVCPHPVDEVLALIQTYQMEFDMENELSPYDLHSGSLFLPWNGFGESNFSHLFSDLILVDSAGSQYTCALKIVLDSSGDMAYNLSGGWTDFCTTHNVVEGDRMEFSVAP